MARQLASSAAAALARVQDAPAASLREGNVPSDLKLGLITPIYKGGARDKLRNYRPVTLTSHVIKVFEKLVA
jgi:hypothetical protein